MTSLAGLDQMHLPRGRRTTLALASAAVLLAAADTYVVVLALPDMMTGVGLGVDQLQRATPIVSAFLLGYVATLPLLGRLADLCGCRPVLIGCLVLFGLGCLVTATADSLGPLVTGRALQGVGGGGLVPATLALVAQSWPESRRGIPLGLVGAVQETGAVLGPLLGAGLLALSGWRAIFWANLAGAAVLGVALRLTPSPEDSRAGSARSARTGPEHARADPMSVGIGPIHPLRSALGTALCAAGLGALALFLIAPEQLVNGVSSGRAWLPLAGDQRWSAPLAVICVLLLAAGSALRSIGAGLGALFGRLDVIGSTLLAGALAALVLSFATADPQTAVTSGHAPLLLLGSGLLLAGFVVRQRTATAPLIPAGTLSHPAAWSALMVNLLVGAALVAALVDIPVFARSTAVHDQFGAALVLLRLLIAVPIGAVLGGMLVRRWPVGRVAATGMLLTAIALAGMTRWDDATLHGAGGSLELVAARLGFGLVIAPVNTALLASTAPEVHGVASAMVVVARMVGMLAGLSVLTAVGLRVFYREQQRIGTVLQLCPSTPAHCPAYTDATHAALLSELHTIFGGAAICCILASVVSLFLLSPRADKGHLPDPASPGPIVPT